MLLTKVGCFPILQITHQIWLRTTFGCFQKSHSLLKDKESPPLKRSTSMCSERN